jgi:hypothetical protein
VRGSIIIEDAGADLISILWVYLSGVYWMIVYSYW